MIHRAPQIDQAGNGSSDSSPALVEIWTASLDLDGDRFALCLGTLSNDERERADAFRFPVDRKRFILAHGQLRILLGRQLALEPAEVSFAEGEFKKPFVSNRAEVVPRFNLSHSGGLAAIATSASVEIGIDLECTDRAGDPREFSRTFLTPHEKSEVAALPEVEGRRRIFDFWTAKEAYLKAIGTGFHRGPRGFEVDFPDSPDSPILFRKLDDSPYGCESWQGFPFECGPGFSATVVIPKGACFRVNGPVDLG